MFKELKERLKIVSNAYVKLFFACEKDRTWYPYKLQNVNGGRQKVRDSCHEYILDSGISDESVENKDVIEKAKKLNPHYVIPKDYYHNQRKTRESIRAFIELYRESNIGAKVLIPLQPPHIEEWCRFKNHSFFALGGIKDKKPEKQISIIRKFREHVGPNVYIHALGVAVTKPVIREIRNNPRLLDSMDVTSPTRNCLASKKIMDKNLQRFDFEPPSGKESTTIRESFGLSIILMLNYMLGPFCDDEVLESDTVNEKLETFE